MFRLVLTGYCCGWIIFSGFHWSNGEEKWFIYLTNWGYLFLTVYLIWATVLTTLQLAHQSKDDNKIRELQLQKCAQENVDTNTKTDAEENGGAGYEYEARDKSIFETLRWYHKGAWVMFSITCSNAFVLSILYWALLYSGGIHGLDLSTHLFNTVFVLLEIMLSSLPIRFLHFIYPFCFATVYTIFTAVYWAISKSNVYPVLDYGKYPVFSACLVVGAVVVGTPLMYSFVFGLFKFRRYLQRKFNKL